MPIKKYLKCFDLFSGIGGFRQGVNEATSSLDISSKWVGRCDIDHMQINFMTFVTM